MANSRALPARMLSGQYCVEPCSEICPVPQATVDQCSSATRPPPPKISANAVVATRSLDQPSGIEGFEMAATNSERSRSARRPVELLVHRISPDGPRKDCDGCASDRGADSEYGDHTRDAGGVWMVVVVLPLVESRA